MAARKKGIVGSVRWFGRSGRQALLQKPAYDDWRHGWWPVGVEPVEADLGRAPGSNSFPLFPCTPLDQPIHQRRPQARVVRAAHKHSWGGRHVGSL
jgi:hypothetical protein